MTINLRWQLIAEVSHYCETESRRNAPISVCGGYERLVLLVQLREQICHHCL
jgi:hypothetical protein